MAMIACSRCHKQISSEASACRHCGKKRGDSGSGYTPKRNFWPHYLLSMVMAVSGAAIYITSLNGTEYTPFMQTAAPVLGIGGTLWYVAARIWAYVV